MDKILIMRILHVTKITLIVKIMFNVIIASNLS